MAKHEAMQRTSEVQFVPVENIDDDTTHDPRTGKPDGIKELARSIEAQGLLTPVTVAQNAADPDRVFIVAGRRRLAACRDLIARKIWPPHASIPALILEHNGTADLRAIALTENFVREPMHPVDTYEAVRSILSDGGAVDDAARRLGLSTKQIRQAEALGKIAPEILKEWRAGKIDEDAARAFTLCPDHKRQVEVFAKQRKAHMLSAWSIRSAIGVKADAENALAAIGEEAYRAAGGQVIRSLFDKSVAVSDYNLLTTLANDKVAAECESLLADGWGWAASKTTVYQYWNYQDAIDQIEVTDAEREELDAIEKRKEAFNDAADDATPEQIADYDADEAREKVLEEAALARMYTPELKAASGCFVSLSSAGIEVEYAKLAPGAAPLASADRPAAPDAGTAPETSKAPISAALMESLTSQMTTAVAKAIGENPTLAPKLALAALRASTGGPVKLSSSGLGRRAGMQTFADSLRESLATRAGTVDRLLADEIGRAIDMRLFNPVAKRTAEAQMIIEEIGPEAYNACALEVFDAEGYFTKASLERLHEAVAEMNSDLPSDDQMVPPKGKKAEVAAWAAARAREFAWLPPQMRFDPGETASPEASFRTPDETEDAEGEGR